MPARTPAPWSYSALEDFKNCPFAYYHKRVIKSVKGRGLGAHGLGDERCMKHSSTVSSTARRCRWT
jgi:hypothetical protein